MSIEQQIAVIIAYVAVGIPSTLWFNRNDEQPLVIEWLAGIVLWPLGLVLNLAVTRIKNPFHKE